MVTQLPSLQAWADLPLAGVQHRQTCNSLHPLLILDLQIWYRGGCVCVCLNYSPSKQMGQLRLLSPLVAPSPVPTNKSRSLVLRGSLLLILLSLEDPLFPQQML